MAGRRHKIGLDYFELDCNLDNKIKLIQAEFGLKGFAIVVKLYQKIYGEDGYYCEWNDDTLLLFMSENGLTGESGKNLVEGVISCCIRRGIFSEEIFNKYRVLTSAGVQKRYLEATSKRDKIELKKEYLLLSASIFNKNVVINSISDGINVNIVCPLAWTSQLENFEKAYPDAFKANVKMPPMGHFGDVEKEIGRACVALATPDFKYMSGETITLEGAMGQRP